MDSNEKDLKYWKDNCKDDYLHTPISVLKYISKLEEENVINVKNVKLSKTK